MRKKEEDEIVLSQSSILDPYSYYLDRFYVEDVYDCKIDDENGQFSKEGFAEHIAQQIKDAKEEKKSYIIKAMKEDPAFIVDAVNDYYLKLIPKDVLSELTHEELQTIIEILDPVTWSQKNLLQKHGGFMPRVSRSGVPYQSQIIRCKSKSIALRAGRRIGKSLSIVAKILHKVYTWNDKNKPFFNVIIFTPNQSQIDLIFKMIDMLIDGNPKLLSMIIENGKIPTRKSPYTVLEFTNNVSIKGFVSGSTAIRGQAADILWLDEASYLTSGDTDAVVALVNEHKNVEQIVTSTPKGLKDWFYERVFDPEFVSFYFPSHKFHPSWSSRMDANFRSQLTDSGYSHEITASFSNDGEGVFQKIFVEASVKDYSYTNQVPKKDCLYCMGVDWNSQKNGTQIKIVEYNLSVRRYRIIASDSVSIEGWTQIRAVEKIRLLNRKWKCSFIYVDGGYGAVQVELLHEMGLKSAANSVDKRLINTKEINFSSNIEVFDPYQKTKTKKPAKPFMVNNAVRVFEDLIIDISNEDSTLIKQLNGYVIDRITDRNVPVYKANEKTGDHALDALMLALLGFTMEYSTLIKPRVATNISSTQNVQKILEANKYESNVIFDPSQKTRDDALIRDKGKEKEEVDMARGAARINTQSLPRSLGGSKTKINKNIFHRSPLVKGRRIF